MTELLLSTGASGETVMMREYLNQLEAAGIPYIINKIDDFKAIDTLGASLDHMEKVIEQNPAENYVFSDAFDVLFFGRKEEIIKKILPFQVLMAAERNCYPDQTLKDKISGLTPWKYANCGLLAGKKESFKRWIDIIRAHPLYRHSICNQTFFNLCSYLGKHVNSVLDTRTELFYCLYKDEGELDFENGIPVNTLTGTHPQFLHFNGKCPQAPTRAKLRKSMGIQEVKEELYEVYVPLQLKIAVCSKCKDRLLAGENL